MNDSSPDFGFWKDGVLSKRQLVELCNAGFITGTSELLKNCGESAIDLSITGEVYELIRGSVKPSGPEYLANLKAKNLVRKVDASSDGTTVLGTTKTYLLPVQERLAKRAQLWSLNCYGQATAKSSIGRLDVLARLIVDGASVYENFTPECLRGSTGELFVEVTPITFSIKVGKGVSLTQLRLFKCDPREAEVSDEETSNRVLASSNRSLSVCLIPTPINNDQTAVAFKALTVQGEKGTGTERIPIDLAKKCKGGKGGTDPQRYWEPQPIKNGYFEIEPDAFYILRSTELITVPTDIAVYCRASDEAVGEMRIHYAGFVHPRFGLDREDGACGTPLIFEVRGHNVPVLLADRERMATLVLYRMSEPYQGGQNSPYGSQTLKLSNHFNPWPDSTV